MVVLVATDLWVYLDARRWAADGSPVFVRMGGFSVGTPAAWLVGCVVLWIFFFPMYLVSRKA
jgi:hypothetical protein